jgi:hypothetical protein
MQHVKHTTYNMKYLLLILFFSNNLVAQDTTHNKTKSYKSKIHTGLNIGFGLQRSLFLQANVSLFRFQLYGSQRGDAHLAQGVYTGIDFFPKLKSSAYPVMAIKLGIAGSTTPMSYYGVELKHLNNFNGIKDFIIMPKFGLGIVGIYGLYYGYNISTNKQPFPFIGNNQFSLFFHLFTLDYRKIGTGIFRYR